MVYAISDIYSQQDWLAWEREMDLVREISRSEPNVILNDPDLNPKVPESGTLRENHRTQVVNRVKDVEVEGEGVTE